MGLKAEKVSKNNQIDFPENLDVDKLIWLKVMRHK